MYRKKAQIPLIKTILILLISVMMLISFLIILLKSSSLSIDERYINAHLVETKLFNSNCFSEKFATIEDDKFTQENLDTCFKNLDEDIIFRVYLEKGGTELYVLDRKNEFDSRKNYCNVDESNVACNHLKYPVTYLKDLKTSTTDVLVLDIISY